MAHLDVVRANGRLVLVRVVKALDVAEVANVERGNVVGRGEREVGVLGVLRDVRVDGDRVARLGPEVVEQLGDTLLAVGALFEGIDDPDLAEVNRRGERRRVLVPGNELDVLDTTALEKDLVKGRPIMNTEDGGLHLE